MELFPIGKEDIHRITSLFTFNLNELDLKDFTSLAVELCVDSKKLKEWKDSIKASKITTRDGLTSLLEHWVESSGGQASLKKLVEVMNSEDLTCLADKVESLYVKFGLPATTAGKKETGSFSLVPVPDSSTKQSSICTYAQEKALSNSVILEEIFRKLKLPYQKVFRQVCKPWFTEILPFWRRTTYMNIFCNGDARLDEPNRVNKFNFQEFNALLQKESKANEEYAQAQQSDEVSHYGLLQHPFRCYKISYEAYSTPAMMFLDEEHELKFWNLCGSHIERLHLSDVEFRDPQRFLEVIQRLLLDHCPNIVELDIDESCWGEIPVYGENMEELEVLGNRRKYSESLKVLHVRARMRGGGVKSILKTCPSLQELTVQSDRDLEGLLIPAANEEWIKLKKLTLSCWLHEKEKSHQNLRKYVEKSLSLSMLTLTELHLDSIVLEECRKGPDFNLYTALAQCMTLKCLKLNVSNLMGRDRNSWFMDLSPISFPNLVTLKCTFQTRKIFFGRRGWRRNEIETGHLKFDFGTLKGMPKLEELFIQIFDRDEDESDYSDISPSSFNHKRFERGRGPVVEEDWVYNGPRNLYMPNGIALDYFYSDDDPILCEKLKQFSFHGWSLNTNDIRLMSCWFPNLKELYSTFEPESLAIIQDCWVGLDKLYIESKHLVSLLQLRPLKAVNKHLRIINHIEVTDQLVEVKEEEGRFYFVELEKEKQTTIITAEDYYEEYEIQDDDEEDNHDGHENEDNL